MIDHDDEILQIADDVPPPPVLPLRRPVADPTTGEVAFSLLGFLDALLAIDRLDMLTADELREGLRELHRKALEGLGLNPPSSCPSLLSTRHSRRKPRRDRGGTVETAGPRHTFTVGGVPC